jgi:hypothetical protein
MPKWLIVFVQALCLSTVLLAVLWILVFFILPASD